MKTRREFLESATVTLILVSIAAVACGGGGGGGTGGGGGSGGGGAGCDGLDPTSNEVLGHTHTVCILQADIMQSSGRGRDVHDVGVPIPDPHRDAEPGAAPGHPGETDRAGDDLRGCRPHPRLRAIQSTCIGSRHARRADGSLREAMRVVGIAPQATRLAFAERPRTAGADYIGPHENHLDRSRARNRQRGVGRSVARMLLEQQRGSRRHRLRRVDGHRLGTRRRDRGVVRHLLSARSAELLDGRRRRRRHGAVLRHDGLPEHVRAHVQGYVRRHGQQRRLPPVPGHTRRTEPRHRLRVGRCRRRRRLRSAMRRVLHAGHGSLHGGQRGGPAVREPGRLHGGLRRAIRTRQTRATTIRTTSARSTASTTTCASHSATSPTRGLPGVTATTRASTEAPPVVHAIPESRGDPPRAPSRPTLVLAALLLPGCTAATGHVLGGEPLSSDSPSRVTTRRHGRGRRRLLGVLRRGG